MQSSGYNKILSIGKSLRSARICSDFSEVLATIYLENKHQPDDPLMIKNKEYGGINDDYYLFTQATGGELAPAINGATRRAGDLYAGGSAFI
ncbi:hypothetical protein GCM10008022_34710 [Paenibacillus hunanensis]|nr:hypothetical protein GCM10008022_34710 [Paenibacillus hunanensis]